MTTLTILFAVWGVIAVVFVALLIYHGYLTQHETDQLFLNETTPSSVHQENDEVVRHMNTIQPILRVVGTLAVLMTIAVAGFWLWQATHQI
jgi:hypothetical protein